MSLTTSAITGRVPMPNNIAPLSGSVTFTLVGYDTQGVNVVPSGASATFNLADDGNLPAGARLWRNTAGLRGTVYLVTVRWREAGSECGDLKENTLGHVQVQNAPSYTVPQLLNAVPPDAQPGQWWSAITQAQYDEMMASVASVRDDRIAAEAAAAAAAELVKGPIRLNTTLLPTGTPSLNVSSGSVPPPTNLVFVRQDTAERTDAVTMQIQRVVTTNDSHVNPKALRVVTVVNAGGGNQREWAVSGEIENRDNTPGRQEAGTAISGVSRKIVPNNGVMFGGHFQVKDETGAATVGGIIGVELNIQANGPDTNANRVGFDLIARTFESGAAGDFTAGLRIRNSNTITGGRWLKGIQIADGNQTITGGVSIENSPGSLVGYGISDTGTKSVGARFHGSYGSAAVSVASGQFISMEETSNIKMGWGVTPSVWGFYNAGNERIGFNMTASPQIRVGGTAVVGSRRTGWGGATGVATRSTFATGSVTLPELAERVKALIDDLTAHGLIGA